MQDQVLVLVKSLLTNYAVDDQGLLSSWPRQFIPNRKAPLFDSPDSFTGIRRASVSLGADNFLACTGTIFSFNQKSTRDVTYIHRRNFAAKPTTPQRRRSFPPELFRLCRYLVPVKIYRYLQTGLPVDCEGCYKDHLVIEPTVA